MFRYKSILTAAVLAAFMFIGFVQSGNADFRIVEFPSDADGYSYDGYTYSTASLKTSEPYLWIEWWVNDELIDIDLGDGVKTKAYFCPYDKIPGTIKGKKHTIEAFATFTDAEDMDWDRVWDRRYRWMMLRFMDFDSYTVRMFQRKSISGYKQPTWEKPRVTGVYGYVELTRHYHDGQNIVMEGNVNAENPTDEDCTGSCWFRHTEYEEQNGILVGTGWSKEHNGPTEEFGPDQPFPQRYRSYGSHYSDSSILNYPVAGGNIGDTQVIILNAHVHLEVSGNRTTDVWHEINHEWTHEFRAADNKNDQ